MIYNKKNRSYRALVSCDWNECLSPSRPFDPFIFKYPNLQDKLGKIFIKYTSNKISYKDAIDEINLIMPGPISIQDMDKYLLKEFSVYSGTLEFIKWCMDNDILFMINTTGWIGYFQRALKLGLIPQVQFISASPFVEYPKQDVKCEFFYLYETTDKPLNTEKIIKRFNIKYTFIIGDSGGDGPHFEWGYRNRYKLIACMAKPSLKKYCKTKGISINYFIGNKEEKSYKIEVDKLISIIESNC